MSDIDPIEFGKLQAKVERLERFAEDQSQKIDLLLEIANKGRGFLWAATLAAGIAGGTLTHFAKKVFG